MRLVTQPTDAPAMPVRADRSRRGGFRALRLALFLLAPALALYALFVIAPLAQAVFYSVFRWNGLEPLTDVVGIANYQRLVTDSSFHRALLNNVSVIGVSLLVQLPFALWIATLLNGNFRGRGLFRVVFFIPYVISEVVAAILWKLLLAPQTGQVNGFLDAIGMGGLTKSWLGEPSLVMWSVLVVVTWKFFGFYTVLFLAALQAVPEEQLEAARLDGANRGKAFWYITLPSLGPTVRIAAFLAIVGSLQLFDLVWVMTAGGPVGASSTMVTYMVSSGIKSQEFGYASAVAVTLAVISFLFASVYQRAVLARDNVESSGVAR